MPSSGRIDRLADVIRILRSRIIRGIYTGRVPSGRILGRDLKVSVSTVDLALAKLAWLGIVRREARHGTFVVPPAERKGTGILTTARFVCNPGSHWTSRVMLGFERAGVAHGLSMLLHHVVMDGKSDEAIDYALDAGASGYCVGTCLLGDVSMEQALRLRRAAAPVVAVDWEFEEPIIPSVSFDNLEAGALLAKHLISLGHRRIVFVEDEQGDPAMRDRIKGMEKVLAASGLPPATRLTLPRHWLAFTDRLLSALPRPAIVGWASAFADFLLERAALAGIRVPEDLSVASFADPKQVIPSNLTIAALDCEALGRLALEALLDDDLWRNPAPRLVPVDHVVGDTCAPPPR